jgi:hypothetical protein
MRAATASSFVSGMVEPPGCGTSVAPRGAICLPALRLLTLSLPRASD